MESSGMLRRVALVRTDVSEELSASFIRVTRIFELGTTQAVTSNRRTLLSLQYDLLFLLGCIVMQPVERGPMFRRIFRLYLQGSISVQKRHKQSARACCMLTPFWGYFSALK
jgi:hypothetical protein